MKYALAMVALLVLPAAAAVGGEIFGTLSEGTKAVSAGVKLEISVAGKTYAAEADRFGAYRVVVKEKGKATLTVTYKEQKPSFQLVSYDKATRYDLVLEVNEGAYSLRRK